MIRQISADLYQLGISVQGQKGYEAVRVYVIRNNGRSILIDCGSHLYRPQFMQQLDEVLAGETPSHIFLTHSELPHAGNIKAVAERWTHIEVLVSNVLLAYIEILPVLPLNQIRAVLPGTVVEINGRHLHFVDALLKDQPGSQWIYDAHTQTLFTGDGFGYYQDKNLVDHFSDEIDGGITVEQFESYHHDTFRFLRWVNPEALGADLDKMFDRRPIRHIAPIHGSTIRHDIDIHKERLKRALANVCRATRSNDHALRS